MRFLAPFAVLVLIASPALANWPLEKMNEQIEKTNVIVGGVCSGTIIDIEERLVLTAHHCITGQLVDETVKEVDPATGEVKTKTVQKRKPLSITVHKRADYEIVSSQSYLVKIVGIDPKNDIALLQVTDADYKPAMAAKLAPDSWVIKRGQTVYSVGNPGIEFDNSVSQGIVSAPQRTVDFGTEKFRMFQHSATTIGGSSGGSILNENGDLIGTVTGGLRGAAIGFAVPISFSKEMIRKAGFGKVLDNK
jgi:S1-C subfamily serine protease